MTVSFGCVNKQFEEGVKKTTTKKKEVVVRGAVIVEDWHLYPYCRSQLSSLQRGRTQINGRPRCHYYYYVYPQYWFTWVPWYSLALCISDCLEWMSGLLYRFLHRYLTDASCSSHFHHCGGNKNKIQNTPPFVCLFPVGLERTSVMMSFLL